MPALLAPTLHIGKDALHLNRSVIHKETLEVFNLQDDSKESKPLGIAIAEPISPGSDLNSATTKAISLLRKKFQALRAANQEGIDSRPSPSLLPILFHTDALRVTELMPSDCLDLLIPLEQKRNEQTILSLEQIKEVFAQLIMALHQLHHVLQLVHRDIKLDNILIRCINNRWYIYLIDFECTAEANDKTILLDGTARYAPPEIKSLTTTQIVGEKIHFFWILDQQQKNTTYQPLDKKAIDCYQMGLVFADLYRLLCPNPYNETNETRTQIEDLIKRLKHDNPKGRLSMLQAKNHALFGSSDTKCQDYFKTLDQTLRAAAPNFDGYNILHAEDFFPEEKEGFYLLPAVQKKIYMLASSLNNQINSIPESRPQDLNYIYMSIYDKAYELSQLTADSKISNIKNLHTRITSIIETTFPIAKLTKNRIRQENEFAKATDSKLKQAVADAYAEYYQKNNFANLANKRWYQFSLHGQPGKDRAKKFNSEIQESKGSTGEIMKSILDYLETSPGRNYGKSFKTILRKKLLADVSSLPLEEWAHLRPLTKTMQSST